jgi:hypothetical protein
VNYPARAFVRTREGKFLDVTPPNAIHAVADQITPSGLVVGPLSDEACGWPIVGEGCIRGYLLKLPGSRFSVGGGTYEEFNYPGAVATDALSVSAAGDIVGVYTDSQNHNHGFLLRDGEFSTIGYPGATSTVVTDINPDGDMVGRAGNPIEGWSLSFLLTAGQFNEIRMPGAVWTGVWGINPAGTLSGHWTGTDGKVRGFIAKRR